jgi:hypothetical protein
MADVLASFDIDWESLLPKSDGGVLLPILGTPIGRTTDSVGRRTSSNGRNRANAGR